MGHWIVKYLDTRFDFHDEIDNKPFTISNEKPKIWCFNLKRQFYFHSQSPKWKEIFCMLDAANICHCMKNGMAV